MPFLRQLLRSAVRKAAGDPRVRDTAKRVFEDEVKPRAMDAWERARPEVEAARDKAIRRAATIADQLNQRIQDSADARRGKTDDEPKAADPQQPNLDCRGEADSHPGVGAGGNRDTEQPRSG